jgi:hypothetical protein
MTTDDTHRSVLILGRSQLVIDDAVSGRRDLGYSTSGPNLPSGAKRAINRAGDLLT